MSLDRIGRTRAADGVVDADTTGPTAGAAGAAGGFRERHVDAAEL